MTRCMIPDLGWACLVIVLDWFSRKVAGWQWSLRCRTQEWREVLEDAALHEFPNEVRGPGLQLISDNGCRPSSGSLLKVTGIH
jgi:putative transposase